MSRRQVVLTLAGTLIALFLSSLDQTIVGTAMPRIIADLGGFAHYTWVTTSYLVTSTVALPITGKLTDMYGRKPFYIAGIAIFVGGSLLSGLSQSMLQIILFRGLQGIGAGVIWANTFAVIGDLFPPAERGKYQGFLSATFGISAMFGPTLGGFITDTLSWHWIFFINVPLGLVTIALFVAFFPHLRPYGWKHHVDYAGITALILTVVPLLLALSWAGAEYSWLSLPVTGMLLVAAIAAVAFIGIERRSPEPIVPLHLFKNPIVAVSVPIAFFNGLAMFGGIIFVPLYFQGVLGLSATASGSFLTPMTLGQVFSSFVSGQILARTGGRYKIQGIVGLGLMTIGFGLLSRMDVNTSYANAVVNIVLIGVGLGIVLPLYLIAVQNAVSYNLLGAATAAVPFFRALGGGVGLAVFGSVITQRFATDFLANLPQASKAIIPAELLNSVTRNAQVLVSPEAQSQLKNIFAQAGPQGEALYLQTMEVLRQALNAGLSEVFTIALVLTALTFVANLFIKEIPLRKSHAPVRPQPGEGGQPNQHSSIK